VSTVGTVILKKGNLHQKNTLQLSARCITYVKIRKLRIHVQMQQGRTEHRVKENERALCMLIKYQITDQCSKTYNWEVVSSYIS